MAKYKTVDDEIATLQKLYFEMSETARGYARQGDTQSAWELMNEVKTIRQKLRWARIAKAQLDAQSGPQLAANVG